MIEKTIVFFFVNVKRRGEAIDFKYFYDREEESFDFLIVPEALVDKKECKKLLMEAISVYSVLLKRTEIALKINWRDKENRVFISQLKK